MDFNIYYLLVVATVAFSVGCSVGVCIRKPLLHLGRLRIGAFSMAIVGFVATLIFLARDADRGSHSVLAEVVVSAVIAVPFSILCASTLLAASRRHEVSVLVLAAAFTVGGSIVYYYIFEVAEDLYGMILVYFLALIETVLALFQMVAVLLNRRQTRDEHEIA